MKQKTILIVSLINAAANTFLAIIKIIIGKIGHSQSLIADGLHSFSDLLSDALVYVAARASTSHPDKEHPYGHQRIETIATIVIGLILLSVAAVICYEAILKIMAHLIEKPTISVIIVAIISIIGNEWLYRYTKKQGEKINSNLLINNAWHKRSDVYVSIIVFFSIIGSWLGLYWFDAIGAIIIAFLILKMAANMIWHSIQELIDRGVDEKKLEEIKNVIESVPGIASIHQLRTRLHGNSIFVDLHIIVDPHISVSEGHHIGEEVHLLLLQKIKNICDVVVHIDPENDEISRPSLYLPNREKLKTIVEERWKDLPGYSEITKMNLHYFSGELTIEIFMNNKYFQNDLTEVYLHAISDLKYITGIKIYYHV